MLLHLWDPSEGEYFLFCSIVRSFLLSFAKLLLKAAWSSDWKHTWERRHVERREGGFFSLLWELRHLIHLWYYSIKCYFLSAEDLLQACELWITFKESVESNQGKQLCFQS